MKAKTVRSTVQKLHPTKRAQLKAELERIDKVEKLTRLLNNMLMSHGLTLEELGLRKIKKPAPKVYKVENKLGVIGLDTRYFNDFKKARKYALHIHGAITRTDKKNPTLMVPKYRSRSEMVGGI